MRYKSLDSHTENSALIASAIGVDHSSNWSVKLKPDSVEIKSFSLIHLKGIYNTLSCSFTEVDLCHLVSKEKCYIYTANW